MLDCGPIILKELMQASRQRRTYVLRALLPALAVVIIAPQITWTLDRYGQDWRAIADVARPIFQTSVWVALIAFSLLAAVYARGTLQAEWTHRTMEVLCASPLTRMGILYGKFAAMLGKILLAGLALLPIMGLWFRMGRIPREMALGSLGVIAASTVLFGSLAFLRAAMVTPRKQRGRFCLDLLLLYLLVPVFVGLLTPPPAPVLVAAVPPWAFWYVMSGTAPGGMAPTDFTLLAIAQPLGAGLLALLLTPWLFRRAFARAAGTRLARGWRGRLSLALGGGRSHRPAIKPAANPFVWQEKGPPTRILRWGPLLILAIVAVFVIAVTLQYGDLDELIEPEWLIGWASIAMAIVGLVTILYATQVFAREKVRNTAQALILTGQSAWTFYLAKLWSVYRGLRWSLLVIAIAIVAYAVTAEGDEVPVAVAYLVTGGLLGPLTGAVIGMAFSVAARSPWQALGVLLLSLPFAWVVGMLVQFAVAAVTFVLRDTLDAMTDFMLVYGITAAVLALLGAGGIVLLCLLIKRWNAWLVGLLHAVYLVTLMNAAGAAATLFSYAFFERSDMYMDERQLMPLIFLAVSIVLSLVTAAFWFLFGVRIFDACMRGEAGRSGRRRAARAAQPVILLPVARPAGEAPAAVEPFLNDPRIR